MSFFVTADGVLTTAGYVGCVVLMVALVVVASVVAAQESKGTGMDARKLAFCAMGMALAFVTSYVKVFELPYGGSVTLFSMLFIVLIANWYGAKTGILVGFAYGLLQFIQGPYVLSLFQVCCVCVCGAGCGRILWKEEKRAADRVYCSCAGEGIFPYVRRVSVLDGLYAGEFPAVFEGAVSDYLQLQLSAG